MNGYKTFNWRNLISKQLQRVQILNYKSLAFQGPNRAQEKSWRSARVDIESERTSEIG